MQYVRVNYVDAEPMKFGEFKERFPKSGGANVERDPADDGYVITYRKGEPNEYVSWCPKAEFDAVSRPVDGMTFGQAIEAMKRGKRVARKGWNGKGMYIWVMPGSTIRNCPNIADPHLQAISDANGGTVTFTGSIRMKTATGEVLTGWLASQTDMLCEDWVVVD